MSDFRLQTSKEFQEIHFGEEQISYKIPLSVKEASFVLYTFAEQLEYKAYGKTKSKTDAEKMEKFLLKLGEIISKDKIISIFQETML
jgi:hypothetical protein